MLSLISRPNNNLIKGPKTQLPMAAKPKDHTQSSPATPLRHRHRQCVWGAPKKAFPIYTLLLICVDAFRTAWGAIPRLSPPPTSYHAPAHSTRLSLSVKKYLSVSIRLCASVCFIIMMHAGGDAWQEPSWSSSSLTCSSDSTTPIPITISSLWLLSFNLVVSAEIVHFENASITITIVVKLHRIL